MSPFNNLPKCKTSEEYLTNYSDYVESQTGKKGVKELREKYQKLYNWHKTNNINLNPSIKLWNQESAIKKSIFRAMLKGTILPDNNLISEKNLQTRTYRDRAIKINHLSSSPIKWYRDRYESLHIGNVHGDYGMINEAVKSNWNKSLKEYYSIKNAIKNNSDEHGSWEEMSQWDKHKRGIQVSIDLYGADIENNLYVVQVRRSMRTHKNGYLNVNKSYFLIGRNENGNPFAHCVGAHKIRVAIKNEIKTDPTTTVTAALCWIWDCKPELLQNICRNGDTALLPVTKVPSLKRCDSVEGKTRRLRVLDSHFINAEELRCNGKMYAKNVTLFHTKRQHPSVKVNGWAIVLIGRRETPHDFSPETID